MGTRAVITFHDELTKQKYSIYQHWDGDPATVHANIRLTQKCWPWPRYEADEFAAAYVATHKTGSGNIRLATSARAHGDLSYSYEVSPQRDAQGRTHHLKVKTKDCYTKKTIGIDYITPEANDGCA